MKLLICNMGGIIDAEGQTAESPLQCMQAAMEGRFDRLIIIIGPQKIRERSACLELCRLLKKSATCRESPMVVLMPVKHRLLLESLFQAGVDYVRFIGQESLSAEELHRLAAQADDSCWPARVLQEICPHIHYREIDARRELSLCAADRCRLVLGSARLSGLCEIPDHRYCHYFLNPKHGRCR